MAADALAQTCGLHQQTRDRVYSLLGLIDNVDNFEVGYNETVAGLFWRGSDHFSAGDSPELIDILKVALLEDDATNHRNQSVINPWALVQSIRCKPEACVRISIRRVIPTYSLMRRIRGRIKCSSSSCKQAPRLQTFYSAQTRNQTTQRNTVAYTQLPAL